jgi:hypothetical protein
MASTPPTPTARTEGRREERSASPPAASLSTAGESASHDLRIKTGVVPKVELPSAAAEAHGALGKLEERVVGLERFELQTKTVIGVLGLLGLLGALTAVFGGYWKEHVDKLDAAAQKSELAAKAIDLNVRRALAELGEDLLRILQDLSKSARDEELLQELAAGENSTKEWAPFATGEHAATVKLLESLYPLVREYADAIKPPPSKPDDNERFAKISAVIQRWEAFDISALAKTNEAFTKEFEPHRANALGVLRMTLAYEDRTRAQRPDFSEAQRNFEAALRLNPRFSKPHMNLGVIAVREWEASKKEDFELLEQAGKSYLKAKDFAQSTATRSVAYNNIADVSLKIALWAVGRGNEEEARRAIAEARMNLRRALAQPGAHTTAYVTLAEVDCLTMKATRERWSADRKSEQARKALASLETAVDLGYLRFGSLAAHEIKERFPSLDFCSLGDREFMTKITHL